MALKKCRECGNDVSTSASACPKCGAKVKRPGCLGIIGGLFVIFLVLGVMGNLVSKDDKKDGTSASSASSPATPSGTSQQIASISPKSEASASPDHVVEHAKILHKQYAAFASGDLSSIPLTSDIEDTQAALRSIPQSSARYTEAQTLLENIEGDAKAAAKRRQSTPAGPIDPWHYQFGTDEMTGKKIWQVSVTSTNEVDFGFPYSGSQHGTLALRVHPRWGKDVFLYLERGQFLCGTEECTVLVRFDDGPPQRFNASEASDNSTEILFIRDYPRFVGRIKKAKHVAIEAQFFQEGSKVFQFDVAGLNWDR